MKDDTATAQPAEDHTKHSNTIRAADGCSSVALTRSEGEAIPHALTISRGGQQLTAWVTNAQIRALLITDNERCEFCRFARRDSTALRCHLKNTGRRIAPPVLRAGFCGKFEPMVPA